MPRRFLVTCLLLGALLASALGVYLFATDSDGYARFRPVLASELMGRAEATLYFPGSSVIATELVDMEKAPLPIYPFRPAEVSTTLRVDATDSQLLVWYQQRVTSLGYHEFGSPGTGGMAWLRGRREFFYLHYNYPDAIEYRRVTQLTQYWIDYWIGVS
jgi:hypothetical protein